MAQHPLPCSLPQLISLPWFIRRSIIPRKILESALTLHSGQIHGYQVYVCPSLDPDRP